MKAVLFMKELGIKMKKIAELLPISKSTIYRKQKLLNHSSESSNVNNLNNLLKQRINQIALKYPEIPESYNYTDKDFLLIT